MNDMWQEIKNQLACVFRSHLLDDKELFVAERRLNKVENKYTVYKTICIHCHTPLYIRKRDDGGLYYGEMY